MLGGTSTPGNGALLRAPRAAMQYFDFLLATAGRVMDVLLIAAIAVLLREARGVVRRSPVPEPMDEREEPVHEYAGASDEDSAVAEIEAMYREAHQLYLAWVAERSARPT